MARFRSQMAMRPINRIKHVIDFNGTPDGATQLDTPIAVATDTPTIGVPSSVETGCKINGFYIRIEVASIENIAAAIPNVYLAIWKSAAGVQTLGSIANMGDDPNKRLVIHQEMIMINNVSGGTPRTLFNGVVVIPKGMRRMAPADVWNVTVRSQTLNIALCIQCHYKEFR